LRKLRQFCINFAFTFHKVVQQRVEGTVQPTVIMTSINTHWHESINQSIYIVHRHRVSNVM